MTVSLYRKYRPITFDDVVGQGHITRTLVNAIKQDRVSHAYLFAGPRGTGKTSTAKILAMALNCEAGHGRATTHPDGVCPRCESIRRGSSLDVLEIDAASNRGIDEIRDIRDRVHFAPVEGRMKVYIVDEVHMLTPEAFNALLKMLEEPPTHAVFVLATTEPHKVLPTILSRCQRFDFRRPSVQEIVRVLASVADREGIEITENTLSVIARAAGGSFRDAVGTLDQLASYCEGTVTLQDALAILGIAEQDLLFELVDIVEERDTRSALLFVERQSQAGADLSQFMKDLLAHLRDLYVVQHTEEPPESVAVSLEHLDGLRSQANRVATGDLVTFIDLLGEAQRAVRQGADPRLELELVLIKLTRPETQTSLAGLAARLERLEDAVAAGDPGAAFPRLRERVSRDAGHHAEQAPRPAAASPERAPAAVIADGGPAAGGPAPDGPDADTRPPAHEAALVGRAAGDGEPAVARIEANIENLKRAWPVILNAVRRHRPSLHALLAEGRPESLDGDRLVIKFPQGMDFQANQVARVDNSQVLAQTLSEITGRTLAVATRVSGPPAPPEGEDDRARILTTEELIEILKKDFNARPIDEERAP